MKNRSGAPVKNQFILFSPDATFFQSYDSIICKTIAGNGEDRKRVVLLDSTYWNYSRTTSKYRALFLGESTMETWHKIESGEYTLVNLNV